MPCATCGKPVEIGEWPWCPHGWPSIAVIDDQLEGGPRHFDTMGHDSPFISTKSEWRREIAARGLVHNDRYDAAHYARKKRQHEERVKDTGSHA